MAYENAAYATVKSAAAIFEVCNKITHDDEQKEERARVAAGVKNANDDKEGRAAGRVAVRVEITVVDKSDEHLDGKVSEREANVPLAERRSDSSSATNEYMRNAELRTCVGSNSER